jgi:site-specific recombinase XerD
MRIESVHDEFLMYLRIERNCSPKTIEAYGGDMKTFRRALAEFGIQPDVEAIDRKIVRQYVVWMKDREFASATIARKINSLRSFWNYLIENEMTEHNPVLRAAIPKQPRVLPEYLSIDECTRLLAAAGQQKNAFRVSLPPITGPG